MRSAHCSESLFIAAGIQREKIALKRSPKTRERKTDSR